MRDSLKTRSILIYHFVDGSGSIEIRWDSFDAVEQRHAYHYRVCTSSDALNAYTHEADDLRSGSGESVNLPKALASLLSFLSAFAEARRYGTESSDNWNLFPEHLAYWAEGMDGEFAMAREEIDPTERA